MATWDDVRRLCTALPEVSEGSTHGEHPSWRVRRASFAWERPLRDGDRAELGDAAPPGPILGLRVADLDDKDALLAQHPGVLFATSHFAGYPAVMAQLDLLDADLLEELLTDAWLARAPKRLAAEHLGRAGG